MIAELLRDRQFQELEKEYKFLSRARGETIDSLDYVILDLETTGLEPTIHEITEIGAIKTKGTEITDLYSTLIKPKEKITPEITRLTGIDNDMVADAPSLETSLPKFLDYIGDAVLIAHNADFDVAFLKAQIKRFNNQQELTNAVLCSVKLSRLLLPGLANYKLHTVAAHLGFKVEKRHRAIGDVELTYQIWAKFLPMLKDKGIKTLKELQASIAQ
ncbi:hypothetical protein A3F86_00500 [candidate division WOR-1 bacterium RIFCSPLOWO2_12_FULL_45_9]|uniref:Exonuclease domain-containing protein n=1 Tax=candidate division WOR-1 bacterium RIFCSPLOWO2_12_FULL_45_9 TaxID=1802568 RepID=A0A1F4RMD4_UNCSA|nr:MAG: hypothetical protein A3F86_00500 [candidate division WOR-1 bacterium RIFCSPLOWO2_12_FULL_45_9]